MASLTKIDHLKGGTKSYKETLQPAMSITSRYDACRYFKQLVKYSLRNGRISKRKAKKVQKINLGYYSGYYGTEVQERVQRLFNCWHPVFGKL